MPRQRDRFSSADLLARLQTYGAHRRYIVGFSGGADSTALLVALHEQRTEITAEIEAIHFNHGLHRDAGQWLDHCKSFCEQRAIPFSSRELAMPDHRSNLEATARDLRYDAVEKLMDEHTAYLTAHNADDRAETFLLHAVRGCGVEGLASIPELRPLGRGVVARPLLDFPRSALVAYLEAKGIQWIEDPSNTDTRIDRNFIRHELMPMIESRWPAASSGLARSAAHARSASASLDRLIESKFGTEAFAAFSLPLKTIQSLGSDCSGLIVRHWIRGHGAPVLPQARLDEFLDQLIAPAPHAQCETAWDGWSLKRFRDEVHLLPPMDRHSCPALDWQSGLQLKLGDELGRLQLAGVEHADHMQWRVGQRRPGAKIRLHQHGPARNLKKVFQEQPIPPWQRASIPVLYWGEEAVAIGDWMYSSRFRNWLDERGMEYRWRPGARELCQTRQKCHAQSGHSYLLDPHEGVG